MAEIEDWASTYLTLHWRLRQFSVSHGAIDFVSYVAECNWGALRLDGLELRERDLAIDGIALVDVDEDVFQNTLSIARERHQAFNWLMGFEAVYSEVTTDT